MNLAMTIPGEAGPIVEFGAVAQSVARLRKGDLDSLTELIPHYQDRLYRYLVRLVRESSAAEDLFQETWLKAAGNIRRYDPERPFDHWLFAIAHNLAIDFLRRRKPDAPIESVGGPQGAQRACALDRLLDAERLTAISNAVGELPVTYREVIALRFEEEMKLEEIAGITGTPLSTIKTRLQRALRHLRERFQ